METYPELGAALKKRREELGLTLNEVPGFKKTTVSRWENGTRRPRIEHLAQLARVYQLNFEELIALGRYPIEDKSPHKVLIRDARDALEHGDIDTAFRLATKLSRTAQKANNQHDLSIAIALLDDILADASLEDLEWRAFKNFDKLILEELRTYSRQHDDDSTIRLTNGLMLKRSVPGSEDHLRALQNLAAVASKVGNFTQMEQYAETDARWAQERGKDNAYQYARLFAEMARFHQGKLTKPHQVVRPPFWNPYVWRVYWWVVLHTAWIQGHWGFIAGGLKEARATYDLTWGPGALYDLAGVEAALQCHRGPCDPAIAHLQDLLVADLGLDTDVAFNIEEDLVHILVTHHHPDATRHWVPLVLRYHHQRATGWVDYWLAPHRRPVPLDWDGISCHSRREVETLLGRHDSVAKTVASTPAQA